FQPTIYLEGQVHGRHILKHKPDARIGVLYQNEEVAKEGIAGLKQALGDKSKQIIKELSFELSDPTVDSQIVTMKSAGVDTFYSLTSPKFATQAIRKAKDIGWKPLQFLFYGSQSISAVLEPSGVENAVGI